MFSSHRLVHRTGLVVRSPRQGSVWRAGAGPSADPPEATPSAEPAIANLALPLPEPTGTGLNDAMREVRMENVHPLRLRLLLEIERTGSISSAAEACGIGQPSASVHLRTLEAAVGRQLVNRTGRGSELTTAGQVVTSHAARVLAALDNMRGALDALETRNRGQLTLAASLMPSVVLIPALLRQFSDRHPGVRVRLRTAPSATVIREVARGIVEVGIAGEVASPERVLRGQIMVDELVGIAPPALLTSDDGWISPGTLARNNLLVGAEGSSTRVVIERQLARAGYRPASSWEFDSYEAIKHAVTEGFGVSFLSQALVSEDIRCGKLMAFRVSGLGSMQRPIHLVQSGDREPTAEATAFTALLADETRDGQCSATGTRSHPETWRG